MKRSERMAEEFAYNARTVIGFLLIITGLIGGLVLGWWLVFEGDIIEIIHTAKLSMPGWVWVFLKVVLSGACGILFISVFIASALWVFSGGGRKER